MLLALLQYPYAVTAYNEETAVFHLSLNHPQITIKISNLRIPGEAPVMMHHTQTKNTEKWHEKLVQILSSIEEWEEPLQAISSQRKKNAKNFIFAVLYSVFSSPPYFIPGAMLNLSRTYLLNSRFGNGFLHFNRIGCRRTLMKPQPLGKEAAIDQDAKLTNSLSGKRSRYNHFHKDDTSKTEQLEHKSIAYNNHFASKYELRKEEFFSISRGRTRGEIIIGYILIPLTRAQHQRRASYLNWLTLNTPPQDGDEDAGDDDVDRAQAVQDAKNMPRSTLGYIDDKAQADFKDTAQSDIMNSIPWKQMLAIVNYELPIDQDCKNIMDQIIRDNYNIFRRCIANKRILIALNRGEVLSYSGEAIRVTREAMKSFEFIDAATFQGSKYPVFLAYAKQDMKAVLNHLCVFQIRASLGNLFFSWFGLCQIVAFGSHWLKVLGARG
ncbi:hypothetical protein DM860_002103 [Cuscuta australis]|uniref:Uncharacterized protein n=1 Tax=Cuscuta australis TaxID=267555 RepID=A0A328DVU9_9ASTE|nr:hypothetical protein DM860_002103 [Cuscuta australis]